MFYSRGEQELVGPTIGDRNWLPDLGTGQNWWRTSWPEVKINENRHWSVRSQFDLRKNGWTSRPYIIIFKIYIYNISLIENDVVWLVSCEMVFCFKTFKKKKLKGMTPFGWDQTTSFLSTSRLGLPPLSFLSFSLNSHLNSQTSSPQCLCLTVTTTSSSVLPFNSTSMTPIQPRSPMNLIQWRIQLPFNPNHWRTLMPPTNPQRL